MDTQTDREKKREGATYQHSLLGEKQQHFNTRQNITVQGPPAAQANIIHNYCWSYMSVKYMNQWCSTFFLNVGCSDTSDSVKCHKGSLTCISAPYVLILCITRDSTGHLEKDQGPYEVHHCSRATASDKKINCCSVTS